MQCRFPSPPDYAAAARAAAVSEAFIAGWRLAQLYDSDELPAPSGDGPQARPLPDHLPGASQMTGYEKAAVLAGQAGAVLTALTPKLGVSPPTAAGVRAVLASPGHDRDGVRHEIQALYLDVRARLAENAPELATAFGLGRMLADTVWLPRSGATGIFAERFYRYRLANAYGWLEDLDHFFPPRAAAAVSSSLRAWQDWVAGQPEKDAKPDPARFGEPVIRALHHQGEVWRRLLSGEKDPMHMVNSGDYVQAGALLLRRCRQIAWHFLWKWFPVIAGVLAGLGVAIWAAVTYAPAGTDRVAAVLVSAVAALGLAVKGTGATLGWTISQAGTELWAAELKAAVGRAATFLPPRPRRRPA